MSMLSVVVWWWQQCCSGMEHWFSVWGALKRREVLERGAHSVFLPAHLSAWWVYNNDFLVTMDLHPAATPKCGLDTAGLGCCWWQQWFHFSKPIEYFVLKNINCYLHLKYRYTEVWGGYTNWPTMGGRGCPVLEFYLFWFWISSFFLFHNYWFARKLLQISGGNPQIYSHHYFLLAVPSCP